MKKFSSQFVKEDEGGGGEGGGGDTPPSNTTSDMATTGLQATPKNRKKFSEIFNEIFASTWNSVAKQKAPK